MAGVGCSSTSSVISPLSSPTWTGLAKRHSLEEDRLYKGYESLHSDYESIVVSSCSSRTTYKKARRYSRAEELTIVS